MALKDETPRTIEKLRSILAHPQEDLATEFKNWLDLTDEDNKADLAKAILAIANHGGGHVVIGFTRSNDDTLIPDSNRPADLSSYSPDNINNVVKKYAEPRFQCRVDCVGHPTAEGLFPIITVPGGHKMPIRAKSETQSRKHIRVNTYYVRRPGPESSPPQTAQEWDDLIRRCVVNSREELIGHLRNIIQGFGSEAIQTAAEKVEGEKFWEWIQAGETRFKEWGQESLNSDELSLVAINHWIAAYRIHGDLKKIVPSQLLRVLKQIERQEPGGSYWQVPLGYEQNEPWTLNGTIEWGIESEPARWPEKAFPFNFWRASPDGLMLLMRGYDEDVQLDTANHKILRVENPIWDVAACCFHAVRLAKALEEESATITFGFFWEGLQNRKLVAVKERKPKERVCQGQKANSRIRCSVEDLETNLPEIVRDLTSDLYQSFAFFEPEISFIEEHITKLKSLTPGISRPLL